MYRTTKYTANKFLRLLSGISYMPPCKIFFGRPWCPTTIVNMLHLNAKPFWKNVPAPQNLSRYFGKDFFVLEWKYSQSQDTSKSFISDSGHPGPFEERAVEISGMRTLLRTGCEFVLLQRSQDAAAPAPLLVFKTSTSAILMQVYRKRFIKTRHIDWIFPLKYILL